MTGGWFMALFYPHFLVFTIKNCYFLVFSFHQHSHHCHHWGAPHPVIFASRCFAPGPPLEPRDLGAAPGKPYGGLQGLGLVAGGSQGIQVETQWPAIWVVDLSMDLWENHGKIMGKSLTSLYLSYFTRWL